MRRAFASLLLALSLLIASGSWAGFILTRTALDPGRSEALADNLLDNTVVRGVIVDRLADAVEAQIPSTVPITRTTIEVAADEALDDPRVEAVVRDGFVRAHQNALNGVDEPVALDAGALGQVAREKAVEISPELDPFLPAAPELTVELPTGGLAFLGTLRNSILRYTMIGALAAAAGVVAALLITTRRPKTLRRVAYWAFANSAFWLLVAYGLPELVGQVAPSSMSIASAVVDVFVGAMIRPALYMAGAGVAVLGLSLAWPALAKRRPAAKVDRGAQPVPGALQQRRPVLEGSVGARRSPAPAYDPYQAGAAAAFAGPPAQAPDQWNHTPYPDPGADRTSVYPVEPATTPYPSPAPTPATAHYPDPPNQYPYEGPTTVYDGGGTTPQPVAWDPHGAGLHEQPTTLYPGNGGGHAHGGQFVDQGPTAYDPTGPAPTHPDDGGWLHQQPTTPSAGGYPPNGASGDTHTAAADPSAGQWYPGMPVADAPPGFLDQTATAGDAGPAPADPATPAWLQPPDALDGGVTPTRRADDPEAWNRPTVEPPTHRWSVDDDGHDGGRADVRRP